MIKTASLDTWTTIFFVVSFFGLFFSIILSINGKQPLKKNWPIALMVLGYSIVLFQYSLYWTGYLMVFPFLNFTVNAWFLCFGPLLYLYTRHDSISRKMILLHFLPALVTLIASFIFFLPYFNIHLFKTPSYLGRALFWISNQPYLGIVSLLFYFSLSVKTAKSNWSKIEHPNNKQLYRRWTRILLLAFLLFILSYTSYFKSLPHNYLLRSCTIHKHKIRPTAEFTQFKRVSFRENDVFRQFALKGKNRYFVAVF